MLCVLQSVCGCFSPAAEDIYLWPICLATSDVPRVFVSVAQFLILWEEYCKIVWGYEATTPPQKKRHWGRRVPVRGLLCICVLPSRVRSKGINSPRNGVLVGVVWRARKMSESGRGTVGVTLADTLRAPTCTAVGFCRSLGCFVHARM